MHSSSAAKPAAAKRNDTKKNADDKGHQVAPDMAEKAAQQARERDARVAAREAKKNEGK